ncbi:class I adenylate-forming enzyme family protein [Aestuariicoccus sp. MJ-SS9]|uniref:class I adenylate-forming enzyme family protein n=1 Tax=Aestuariicoccus sp. MJ-SS9 TaxID=3079855 RepID=UPI0029155493|nr:class I adenylate-forming enzyme family protein [Aestuariicoccus sp. MJ-SS9]MDU8912075.1 class I adenylate-forming enzyme family protein [Aestuariicoccus sp. MJ-SS9]
MALSLHDTGAPPPCPAPFNLAQYVLEAGLDVPDKIALAVLRPTGAKRISHASLRSAVLGTATGLLHSGLNPGDKLLMRLGNTPEFPIAYLGAIAAGIVPVPTSSQLTEPEVQAILASLKPAAVLHQPGIALGPTNLPVLSAEALDGWHALPPAAFDMGDSNRLAYIVYTSGTSGTPRAVGHAHRAVWARRMMHRDWYGLRPDDRLMHAGAFNWTFTLGTGLLDPWSVGATALVPAEGVEIAQLPLLIRRNDATLFAAAPGVFRKLLGGSLPDLPRLRHALSAGEKLSEPLRAAWRDATGTEVFEAFGMSECSTFISAAPHRPAAPGALGMAQTGRRVAVLGEDGTPVPRGTEGTIAVHRDDPGLMLGYVGAPEATAARNIGEWFLTGDRGIMDDDGQITYRGRADDMMNAGGYRVSPLEVEAALADLPGITEIAVTDIEVKPDVRLIAAAYTGPAPLDEDALLKAAQTRLARYKCPRRFVHLPQLPRNPNGKLSRSALRALIPL